MPGDLSKPISKNPQHQMCTGNLSSVCSVCLARYVEYGAFDAQFSECRNHLYSPMHGHNRLEVG